MNQNNDEIFKKAHKFSFKNEEQIKKSKKCVCFYCERCFKSSKITEWVNEAETKTAICPYCGIDAVIGDFSGLDLTKEFLKKMYKYWFST